MLRRRGQRSTVNHDNASVRLVTIDTPHSIKNPATCLQLNPNKINILNKTQLSSTTTSPDIASQPDVSLPNTTHYISVVPQSESL